MNLYKKMYRIVMLGIAGVKTLKKTFLEKNKGLTSNYIWNKAIAHTCGVYPITYPESYSIPKNFITKFLTFNYLFRYLTYNNINKKIKIKNSVYVKTEELEYFSKKILPEINRPFVLVTGDSDYSTSKFKEILKNKFLIHWFAQNNDIKNKKITPIPIGLDYHTLLTENAFQEKKKSVQKQEKILESIREIKLKQQFKIFANFHLNCTSKRRRELYEILKNNKLFYFQKTKLPRIKMWKLQKKFLFNFSPIGNGMDCVRTWESLILRQIPIIEKTNTALDDLYKQFPIVLIEDISELTEQNLRIWKKKYSKQFNKELEKKLTNDYWIEEIRDKTKV